MVKSQASLPAGKVDAFRRGLAAVGAMSEDDGVDPVHSGGERFGEGDVADDDLGGCRWSPCLPGIPDEGPGCVPQNCM